MKMRAVGNYRRSGYEDNSTLDKEQVTLIITDFIASILGVRTSTSEFLPTLVLPNLTPTEVHLLDLRAELGESYKVIYHSTFNDVVPTYASSFADLELRSMPSAGSLQFGPTLAWLERWKFTLAPYAAGTKESIGVYRNAWDQEYDAPNQGYWDTYANTQIKDFGSITILDVINNPNRRTNFAKEAYITIIKQDGIYTFDGSETVDDDFITMDELDVRSDSSTSTMDTVRITFDTV
jgi:hypothetical protein